MPKLKEPSTLQKLAKEAATRIVIRICQKGVAAIIGSEKLPQININGLREYLYAELPQLVCCELSDHTLSAVVSRLKYIKIYDTYYDCGKTDFKTFVESLILASVYPNVSILDMSNLGTCAPSVLTCNIHTFQKLHTLIFEGYLPTDVAETLPIGLSFLKCLVVFRMKRYCTDAIIQTLGLCCFTTLEHIHANYSNKVTDASFKIFMNCQKLKYLSICGTSMTGKGFLKFLKSIQQYMNSDVTAKGYLRLGVGSWNGWDNLTRLLNEISISCPILKQLEICELSADMTALVSLTTLEGLHLFSCDLNKCNLQGFLRVRGSLLISLELEDTENIDLTCIMTHCINIKKLSVSDGSILHRALGNLKKVAKACQNLEILELSCEFSPSSIISMLYACVNVTRLLLEPDEEHITDELILRLLSNNPFKKLTCFSANSAELTMKSVNAIIEHCPLLEELQCSLCHAITEAEVKILQQRIKNTNKDLRVHFSF